jgi:hypothetical protein
LVTLRVIRLLPDKKSKMRQKRKEKMGTFCKGFKVSSNEGPKGPGQ